MAPKFQTPSLEQSFGTQYYGTNVVSGFMYDVSSGTLYTLYRTVNYDVFLNVPLSVAQQFAVADRQLGGSYRNPNIPYPDDIYNGQIAGNYPKCLLCENGGPLVCENGQFMVVT